MKPALARICVSLLALTLLPANQATSAPPANPPVAVAADPDSLYAEAERLYLKGEAAQALQALSRFFSLPSGGGLQPRARIRAHNLRGLIHFQSRNLSPAVAEFEAAVQLANRNLQETDSLLHLARYNLGNAQFQQGRTVDALESLQTVTADALDQDTRMRFHHLLGNVYAASERPLDSVVNYLTAAHLAKDIAARDTFLQKALNGSKNLYLLDPKADIDRIASLDFASDSAAGVAARVLLARGHMYIGEAAEAESLLRKALDKAEPAHPLRARAEESLADISQLTDVKANVVGMLLPLSGKFAKFGRLCLNAILMAAGTYEEMPEGKGRSNIRLVVRDSGETAELAQERFEELAKEEKAIAVIGPLLSKQFPVVARKAQEYGVPLFSLSQRVETSQLGPFVFPVALTPNQQIEMIVSHAMAVKGYKRFAILAPSDSFGESYVNLFWDAVEAGGGEVVGVERYEPRSTDFQEQVRRLLGLEALGARGIEMADLKHRQDQYASTLKVRGKLRQRLLKAYDPKGVVDFDAVFIPDDPATVGQIAPAFAVQDVDNVPMLGINTWNTSEIVQRAGRYLQKSLFVDGFFASSQSPKTIQFVQDYMKNFHSIPGTIEVQAFDAANILLDTLADGAPSSRGRLREQLLAKAKFTGISGEFRLGGSGVQRGAHLLTIKGNSIVEIPAGGSAQN